MRYERQDPFTLTLRYWAELWYAWMAPFSPSGLPYAGGAQSSPWGPPPFPPGALQYAPWGAPLPPGATPEPAPWGLPPSLSIEVSCARTARVEAKIDEHVPAGKALRVEHLGADGGATLAGDEVRLEPTGGGVRVRVEIPDGLASGDYRGEILLDDGSRRRVGSLLVHVGPPKATIT